MKHCTQALKNRLLAILALTIGLLGQQAARADVKMSTLFSSNMVVQRDRPVPIWGSAAPDEKVTVKIAEQAHEVVTGADGKWRVQLDPLPVGGPYQMTIKGRNTVQINGILSGEVWLASGQSNMVHIMQSVEGFEAALADCDYPQIRIIALGGGPSRTPRDYFVSTWRPANRDSVDDYSAVAYYFALALHKKLGVPVGVINASLGSTPIEAWTSLEAQQNQPELGELLASWDKKAAEYDPVAALAAYEKDHGAWEVATAKAKEEKQPAPREPKKPLDPRDQQAHPAVMFNGLIAPVVPYGIRGVIWYQGEFNTTSEGYAALYKLQLPLLINDWRERWGQKNLPFAWIQLPNFDTTTRSPRMTGWPLVREGQLKGLSLPNTGMAVTIDIGEAGSVHPRNKKPFADRLALWARAEVYGENIPWSGPIFQSQRAVKNEVELTFKHADGLQAKSGELQGFLMSDKPGNWYEAKARIVNNKVVVWHDAIRQPRAVRYSWADNPHGNLTNAALLPASPFRTDTD